MSSDIVLAASISLKISVTIRVLASICLAKFPKSSIKLFVCKSILLNILSKSSTKAKSTFLERVSCLPFFSLSKIYRI